MLPELSINSFSSSFANSSAKTSFRPLNFFVGSSRRLQNFHLQGKKSYKIVFKVPIKGVSLCEFLYSIQANLGKKLSTT